MKRYIYILILFCLCFITVDVDALNDVKVALECSKTELKFGDTTTCELTASVSSSTPVDNLSLSIVKHADLSLTYEEGPAFAGSLNGNNLVLSSDSLKSGNLFLGKFKVKVSEDGSFGEKELMLQNINFSNTQNTSGVYKADNVTATLKVLSTVNTLESITISNGKDDGTLNVPNFEPEKLTYNNVNVTGEKIVINVTKTSDLSTVEGVGEKTLKYGENKFEIIVTSQSGLKRTYNLVINREDKRSNVNTLKTLTIEGINLAFDSKKNNYTVNVESNIDKVNISSTLTDKKASYVKDYGNRSVDLAYGENKIEIKVKSEKGNINTYTLTVNRNDDRSDVAKLISLSVNDKEIEIKNDVYEYNVSLRYKNEKSVIKAVANSKATISYKDIDLKVGDNTLIIKVKSEKETVQEYKINIKRLTEEESKVSFTTINVKGYQLNFTKDVRIYDLKIDKNVSSLEFEILPVDEVVTHNVSGNTNLVNGSKITINVKDDFGEYIYTINISKDVDEKLILGFLTLEQICYIVFVIGLLIFLSSIIYAIKKKNNKNK